MVGVTCANGNVFVATSKGFLIRYHWDEYGGEKVPFSQWGSYNFQAYNKGHTIDVPEACLTLI